MIRAAAVPLLVALLVVAPLGSVAADVAAGPAPAEFGGVGVDELGASAQSGPNPCVGTVRERPDRGTVISIQGAHAGGKTVAMLVGFRPSGEIVGVHNATANGRWWAYDVDRLPNGNFLMPTTQNRHTVVEEINDTSGEHVSVRHFEGVHDAHDVDLINGDELVMNDMGDEHNRVLVYNLTREDVVWEYRFDNHTDVFPRDGGGPYGEDWTHNNDVDEIEPGVFMVSVRNFDQVVAIDRSTKEIQWTLGEDDNATVLDEQHNPDYIETEDGRPTVIVADSLNDRVVEYTREGDSWNRTWVLRGGGLDEPRDADRLPNGNTLVSDRRGHRLLEVTPEGEVLWEVYTPYQPYDAERLGTVDESSGPAMVDANATGTHAMTGNASFSAADVADCYDYVRTVSSTRLVPEDDPGPVGTDGSADVNGGDADGANGSDGGDGPNGSDAASPDSSDGESVLGTTTDGSSGSPRTALVGGVVLLVAVVVVGAALVLLRR